MSNAVATEPPGAGLNWRQRKRRKALIDGYVHALGGRSHISALQRRDIERCVDLELLATAARSAALRGEESLGNVMRLEIQASKAVRRLNLPVRNAAAPVTGLHDIVAKHTAGSG